MEHTQSFRFFNRGPNAVVRLIFFSLLSALLLFVDARYRHLEAIRSVLSVPTQSLQTLTALPSDLWQQANIFWVSQGALIEDNAQLQQQHLLDAAQLQQLQAVQAENLHLRTLLRVQQEASYSTHPARVVYIAQNAFDRKLLLAKDEQTHVQAGQVVVDDSGVVGQVTRIYPLLNEVTLITDKDHTVPVQVLRNGLRAIAVGSGDVNELTLRYLPISSDIQEGDILVTSGIDGTYPPGLPVAAVSSIERDPAYPFADIRCVPIAGVDKHRYLMIVSPLPGLPLRPEAELSISKPGGNAPKNP